MILQDLSALPPDAARVMDLAAQLRLPDGAATDPETNALLERLSAVAVARIERSVGRVLTSRTLTLRTRSWTEPAPIFYGPVRSLDAVETVDRFGSRVGHSVAEWRIEETRDGAILTPVGGATTPRIAEGDVGEARLTVGHGPAWRDAPAELREAAILAAAAAFEAGAAGEDPRIALPVAATALIAPFRRLRL